ncbi:MAG TPA: beta-N-acetylglucosaminidase domain-containing protein [Niabella sp.]|nr:beta-N-acetylglucosaminidase domain-containing protein [Niabella sp.]HQX21650.1 beta-N-acetylglucosaminidase domain-containing protein [Niabella sp.]HQX42683.1 beta-N-acetylglucosaminidase domain-containing protein [Niabella sp.]HRC22296.1 beta-N-acetylglucosaminidase domain-containing protein [Niabella sp.]
MRVLVFLFNFYIIHISLNAQEVFIFPTPQRVDLQQGSLRVKQLKFKSSIKIDAANLQWLQAFQPVSVGNRKMYTTIQVDKLTPSNNISQLPGAYAILVNKKGIRIRITNQASLFYALKTLEQFSTKNAEGIVLPFVAIQDYPDVLHRGTVEGFYGKPWSFNDRVSQLKFYGDLKLNTYIYGPKDDPFHSSPDWRKPYPQDKAEEIKQLVQTARDNYVDFVWAIHPGKDINWNKQDSLHLLNKFEMMYALGVRAFAVFFDDISGEGTRAQKQADLLNYLHKEFVTKHKDVQPLILCPTEYNKSWSDPKPGTYLDILGDQLHPSIHVMWTGNRVISDVDQPTLEWINKRIKRKAYIWWNFPVSDYVRDHLLMGPAYGNTKDIADRISGFVSNPMERAEASKIGVFGAACYTWNLKQYDSAAAFKAAIRYIAPDAEKAFQLFAENNSDLGPNGHGYRRTETVRMGVSVRKLETALLKDIAKEEQLLFIRNYYDSIAQAPAIIFNKVKNRNLILEIEPWLNQFELLGKAGTTVLDAIKNYSKTNPTMNWNRYLLVSDLLDSMAYVDRTQNQNPYQPGVKTGAFQIVAPKLRF